MILNKITKEEREQKDVVSVYTTCANLREARRIGFSVIKEKLAACIDFWPISSIYPWQGVIEEIDQYLLMLTTQKSKSEELIKYISKIHSYSVPFISEIKSSCASSLYKNWVDNALDDGIEYITKYEKKIKKELEAEGNFHPGKLN